MDFLSTFGSFWSNAISPKSNNAQSHADFKKHFGQHMSYSVSCDPSRRSEPMSYEDWVSRGCPPDVIFHHAQHSMVAHMHSYFMPAERIVYTHVSLEYYDIHAFVVLYVDEVRRSVGVDKVLCVSENHWLSLNGSAPRSGRGGISWLKRNADVISPDFLSLSFAVRTFFGPQWTVASLPMTRPSVPDDAVERAKDCPRRLGNCKYGPWNRTVGTYFRERIEAATVIQRHFRGWRVRMATTFNPHTRLGRFCALRMLRQMQAPALR